MRLVKHILIITILLCSVNCNYSLLANDDDPPVIAPIVPNPNPNPNPITIDPSDPDYWNKLISSVEARTNPYETRAYRPSAFPATRNLVLKVHGREIANPSVKLLRQLYGEKYEQSAYWRVKEDLENNKELNSHLDKLQSTSNNDIKINVHYDYPDKFFPGETLQYYNIGVGKWKEITVEKGDTVETLSKKMGITSDEFKAEFDIQVHPHAIRRDSEVHLGEATPLSDDTLRGVLVHELAHNVDGTCFFGSSYGPDGDHYMNEITNPLSAWKEGWAAFNEGLFSSETRKEISDATDFMTTEVSFSSREKSIELGGFSIPFAARVGNEGTVAAILTALDGDGAHRQEIMDLMREGNKKWQDGSLADRNIKTFLSDYVKAHPEQIYRTLLVIDSATNFTAKTSELAEIVGEESVKKYMVIRSKLYKEYLNYRMTKTKDYLSFVQFFDKAKQRKTQPVVEVQRETEKAKLPPMTLLEKKTD